MALTPDAEDDPTFPFSPTEVRHRAVAGAAIIMSRAGLVRLLSIGGNIALARLLFPHDFGIVALGFTVVVAGGALFQDGLAFALVRQPDRPELEDLETLLGVQLAVAIALGLVAVLLSLAFTGAGLLIATMTIALPLQAVKVTGIVTLERGLAYRSLTLVDIAETVSYVGLGVTAAALSLGAWSLVMAVVARSATGAATTLRLTRMPIWRPRFHMTRVRSLITKGRDFQLIEIVLLGRDQGLNILVAPVAGVPALGIWSLAYRMMQVPQLVFDSLWRVSFTAWSRLHGDSQERLVLERALRDTGILAGAILVPLVGSSRPLVPALLGTKWMDVALIIPWAGLGLLIAGPIRSQAGGYLYAVGDTRSPLRSAILQSCGWFAVTLPLLPLIGVTALGIGWLVAAMIEAWVLGRRVARQVNVRVLTSTRGPLLCACFGGALGWIVAESGTRSLGRAALSAAVSEAGYLIGLLLFARQGLFDVIRLARRGSRGLST
jgi:O-antigen/teichoic acid export membrane protein